MRKPSPLKSGWHYEMFYIILFCGINIYFPKALSFLHIAITLHNAINITAPR